MLVSATARTLQLDMFDQVAGLTGSRVDVIGILATMPAIMQVLNLAILFVSDKARRRRWYFAQFVPAIHLRNLIHQISIWPIKVTCKVPALLLSAFSASKIIPSPISKTIGGKPISAKLTMAFWPCTTPPEE